MELTRRGKPVAVLLSMDEYLRLQSPRRGFLAALRRFRRSADLEALQVEPEEVSGWRDRSPGRLVDL